jgi:hypothetical protein
LTFTCMGNPCLKEVASLEMNTRRYIEWNACNINVVAVE